MRASSSRGDDVAATPLKMSLGCLSAPAFAARALACGAAPRGTAAAACTCLGGRCLCAGRTAQLRSPAAFLDARHRAGASGSRSSVLSGASRQPGVTLHPLLSPRRQRRASGHKTLSRFLAQPLRHSPPRRPASFPPAVSAQAAPAAAAPLRSVLNQRGAPLTPPSAGPAPPVWHAIIEVGGAQQIVSEGRFYSCHSLPGVQAGQKVVFERVLATKQPGGALAVGKPYVAGAKVHATVLENFKDKKIIVFKMKAKKHYRRKAGHRQHMTRFLVTKVEFGA